MKRKLLSLLLVITIILTLTAALPSAGAWHGGIVTIESVPQEGGGVSATVTSDWYSISPYFVPASSHLLMGVVGWTDEDDPDFIVVDHTLFFGDYVVLQAEPNSGWRFDGWYEMRRLDIDTWIWYDIPGGDPLGSSDTHTISFHGNKYIESRFSRYVPDEPDEDGAIHPPQNFTYTAPAAGGHSDWAASYLARAEQLGLIPSSLQGQNVDLRSPITRAEFAGVVVMAFESLSERQAIPAASNRFADTQDNYILRAYNAGLMVGTGAATFEPNTILNREQTATALTRVFKSSTIPGWTMANDREGLLEFTWPALFADDANISDWARESVYFMAANEILQGTGNNMFSPRAVTTAQQAIGYADATREQAIVIALRMLENLG